MGFSRNRVGRDSAFFTAWARRALGLPAGTVVLAREVPTVEAPNAIFTGLTSLLRLANSLPPFETARGRHAWGPHECPRAQIVESSDGANSVKHLAATIGGRTLV